LVNVTWSVATCPSSRVRELGLTETSIPGGAWTWTRQVVRPFATLVTVRETVCSP
jgi:hypothetical protein